MELIVQRPHKQIYRSGGQRVKLFGESVPASDVLNEALNQARAEEAGLPVPCLREVTKISGSPQSPQALWGGSEGRWAVVADFIEGPTLLERMEAEPDNPRWMELFVRLQMQVHAARAPQMQRQKDKLNRRISASAACGLDATTRYELHVRLEDMPDHQKVCHGDFVPSNVLLRGEEALIIDWSHATQGNASADAANTYLTLLRQGRDALACAYLKLFCELSDTALQYIQRWIPIVAGAALCKCETEEERVFYRGWCEGVV